MNSPEGPRSVLARRKTCTVICAVRTNLKEADDGSKAAGLRRLLRIHQPTPPHHVLRSQIGEIPRKGQPTPIKVQCNIGAS